MKTLIFLILMLPGLAFGQNAILRNSATTNTDANTKSAYATSAGTSTNVASGGAVLVRNGISLSFASLTNILAYGLQTNDLIELQPGTNSIVGWPSPMLPLNVTIKGLNANSCVVLCDTNFCYVTNNDYFEGFSCVGGYQSSYIFSTPSTSANAFGCVWKNVKINTLGNGIGAASGSTGLIGYTVDGCDISSQQRAVFIGGAGAGSYSTVKNSTIYVQEGTNSVTIIGLSLGTAPGGGNNNGSNIIQNCIITVDCNNSTNAVEYLGIYSGSGTNWITGTTIRMFNYATTLSYSTALSPILNETTGTTFYDSYCPSSQWGYNYSSSESVQIPLTSAADIQKVGGANVSILGSTNGTVYDIPAWPGALYISSGSQNTNLWLQHFVGYPTNLSGNFSGLPQGSTNNIVFNGPGGLSVVFSATNGLWVTNYGAGNILMSFTPGDPLLVTNLGTRINAYRLGNAQRCTLAGGFQGVTGGFTTLATNQSGLLTTNTITETGLLVWGEWNSGYNNLFYIKGTVTGTRTFGCSDYWFANLVSGARGIVLPINYTGNGSGLTNLPVTAISSFGGTSNTLAVASTGITNNTSVNYLLTITAGTGLALKDGNGNGISVPVLGDTVPLKPGWRFTGTAVTAQCYQFP